MTVKLALRGLRGESAADIARRVLDIPDATDSEALAALLGLDLPTVYPVAQNEGSSTANAIVASAAPDLTAYVVDQLYFYRHLGVANTAAGPTKNIDGLGAKKVVDDNLNDVPAGYYQPNYTYLEAPIVAGGITYIRSWPLTAEAQQTVYVASGVGGTANAITMSTPRGLVKEWSQNNRFQMTLAADVTVATPTISVDGLTAKGLYDAAANVLPQGFLRAGMNIEFRYTTSFDCLRLVSPRVEPRHSPIALRALQIADSAAAGARANYLDANPSPLLDPTPLYNNTMDVSGDATVFKTAHGSGPDSAATYDSLTWSSAGGGYAEATGIATAGASSWWWDWNHVDPGPGFLNLLIVANTVENGGGPLPNIADLTNIRVTFELEAVDLYLPDGARLVFHWQGQDVPVEDGGTGKAINYHWHEPLDVALGSGGAGMGWPPIRDEGSSGTTLNGSATYQIDFVPNDAFWYCLGSSLGRYDIYNTAPVSRVMTGAALSAFVSSYFNMQIQVAYPQQYGGMEGPRTPPFERATGALRLKSFKIEEPA